MVFETSFLLDMVLVCRIHTHTHIFQVHLEQIKGTFEHLGHGIVL